MMADCRILVEGVAERNTTSDSQTSLWSVYHNTSEGFWRRRRADKLCTLRVFDDTVVLGQLLSM